MPFGSFRRLKKLKDVLVRARLPKPPQVLRPRGKIIVFVKIIDRTYTNKHTEREKFWIYNLNSFTPNGPNLRDFM